MKQNNFYIKTDSKILWTQKFDLELRCKSLTDPPKLYVEIYSSQWNATDIC